MDRLSRKINKFLTLFSSEKKTRSGTKNLLVKTVILHQKPFGATSD
jgi:hypothetical protein